MNRATRLSLIAVMLLATTALGIISYKSMYPDQPVQEQKQEVKQEPAKPAQPRPNPEYEKLKADLEQHDRHCLQLTKQATILLGSQNQNQGRGQAEQRVTECRNLVEIERKYVENFPNKEIKQ